MKTTTKLHPYQVDRMQALIDGVDEVAKAAEAKWGVGRLRLLVSDDLREKFDRQGRKLNQAIWTNDVEAAEKHAPGMRKGWQALDAAATAAGAQPLSPAVWEVPLSGGCVAALVRSVAEVHQVAREGRYLQVWSVEEIARLIEAFPEVAKAKEIFPGAEVLTGRPVPASVHDDAIPF
jgi:hypothetical protein